MNNKELIIQLHKIGMPMLNDAALLWVKCLINQCRWAAKHGYHEQQYKQLMEDKDNEGD